MAHSLYPARMARNRNNRLIVKEGLAGEECVEGSSEVLEEQKASGIKAKQRV